MVHRKIESAIDEILKYFRVVAINGPRQSGKTILQKKIAKSKKMDYYTFDDSKTFNMVTDDTNDFIEYISKEKM